MPVQTFITKLWIPLCAVTALVVFYLYIVRDQFISQNVSGLILAVPFVLVPIAYALTRRGNRTGAGSHVR